MPTTTGPLYLGLDLSTQQLKAVLITPTLDLVRTATVSFDDDFPAYGLSKGVLTDASEAAIFAPVALWLEALDLVLSRLGAQDGGGAPLLGRVRGISGAGMQHGTVFWRHGAEGLLGALGDGPGGDLKTRLGEGAFSHAYSPNWQDASTEAECAVFDGVWGREGLAGVTGSGAHHRFSGPQILRFKRKHPEKYAQTARISLVSSFLASVLLGSIAPIDISDVCGMNLWDVRAGTWHADLLGLVGPDLLAKLGPVPQDGGADLGRISPYFVQKYGFDASCRVAAFTGDNPATILSLPLRAGDAMVSLGTSTTFLMSTTEYRPDPAYHFFNHPTTAGLYMFMLCYKNGSLARELVRDRINESSRGAKNDWTGFNRAIQETPALGGGERAKMGLYFPRHEIVPAMAPGEWRFSSEGGRLQETTNGTGWKLPEDDARAIVESQMLSSRLRSSSLVSAQGHLPPQPRRIYLVGGASVNPAIAQVAGEVLGGAEGVYRLELSGNACALGAAYKAVWALERKVQGDGADVRGGQGTEAFEELIAQRWREADFITKIDPGYREGVFEGFGDALPAFAAMEEQVLAQQTRT